MAASCPNKSSSDWKNLVAKIGVNNAYLAFYENGMEIPDYNNYPDTFAGVNAGLKMINVLTSEKGLQLFNRFFKGNPNKFYSELVALAGRQQTEMLQQEVEKEGLVDLADIVTHVAKEMSYTVEINTSKVKKEKTNLGTEILPYGKKEDENTSHYSSLTVPGGTNYTEQEIATPAITPSIKGHAQFATDNGIGWFRSDEQVDKEGVYDELGFSSDLETSSGSKTRRILEVQSDLFQKGRDKADLIKKINPSGFEIEGFKYRTFNNQSKLEYIKGTTPFDEKITTKEDYDNAFLQFSTKEKDPSENQFLQLLNKNNNWVTFFVKSIIQDSARKGYEKVLFPTGNTASKVEGHSTLEEFKKQKEDRILSLKEDVVILNKDIKNPKKIDNEEYGTSLGTLNIFQEDLNFFKQLVTDEIDNKEREIAQLKQELERVETEGFGALKPIYNFYENTVTNILNKTYGKENVKVITDEYGNTWNELTLEEAHSEEIYFQKESRDEGRESPKELDEAINKFLEKIGVTVKQVKEITNRNGEVIGANAMADLLYKTIQVVEGKAQIDTLPEEASHFLVAMLRNSPLYTSMYNDIIKFDIYKEVVAEYSEQYKGNEQKLREEAMGKLIASLIVGNFTDSKLEKRADSWWNRVLTYLKGIFNNLNKEELENAIVDYAPFSEAADMIINNRIDATYQPSEETENEEFYQLHNTQEEVVKAIKENLGRGSLSIEGKNYVLTKNDGTKTEIPNRVSDRVAANMARFSDREKTPQEELSLKTRAEYGTKGHNDLQNIIDRAVAIQDKTIIPSKSEELGTKMYTVLEKYMSKFMASFPTGTVFLTETKIHDPKAKEGATPDLIVVYPDGTIDIYDWKFQEFKGAKDNKVIAAWKKKNWNTQLGRYVEILEKVYGIKKENIKRKRVIPIEAIYEGNVLKSIKVGEVEIENFGKSNEHLKPVPINSEITGDERLDKLIEDLLRQKEILNSKKPSNIEDDSKRAAFIEQRKVKLLEIDKAIEDIQLNKNVESYIKRGLKQLKDIQDVKVENLSEGELTEALKLTEFYGKNLMSILEDLVENKDKDFANDLRLLVTNSQGIQAKISNEFIKRGKTAYGENINEAVPSSGWWERQMRTLSQQSHPVLKAFYKLLLKAKEATANKLVVLNQQIEEAISKLETYQKNKGINNSNMFDFMLDKTGKHLRIIAKYTSEFYDSRNSNSDILRNGSKEEQNKALKWFKENTIFDEERYDKAYEEYEKQSKVYYKNWDKPQEAIKRALSDFSNKYGNNIKGYSNTNNYYVRPKEDFFSDKYKEIQSTPELKEFYDLFTKETEEYRKITGQKHDARFVWNIKKDFVDSMAESGIFSTNPLNFLNDAVTLNKGIRDGNVDPQTGEADKSIPIYYTEGVETARQSTDLGRVLYLAGAMAYNYKHMAEIEDSTKSLEIILKHSETLLTDNEGKLLHNKLTGRIQKIIGSSETIDQYKDYLNYYVYGVKNKTKDRIVNVLGKEFSLLASYNFVAKFFMAKTLSANPVSIIANGMGGDWNVRILGAGKRFFNNSDYNSSLKDMAIRDKKAYSIIGYLDLLDRENVFEKANDLSVSKLTKHLTYANSFIGQKAGDFIIRNGTALAMLKSHKLEGGKIVKITDRKKGETSIYDLLEVKDEKLNGLDSIPAEEMSKLRTKILKVTEDILGNNSRDDIRLAQLTVLGRALMAFRSWIPRTIDSRYGELRYDEDIEAYELGRYRSFWNQIVSKQFFPLFWDVVKRFGTFGYSEFGNSTVDKAKELYKQALLDNPNLTLTEQEYIDIHIANLKADVMELHILGTMLTLIFMAKPSPDDDKDDISAFRKYTVRQMERNLSELQFYYSPKQFNTIIKSPLPILRAFTDIFGLFYDTGKEAAGALTGNEKWQHDARPLRYGLKIFPVINGLESWYSQFDEDYDKNKELTYTSKSR